jgi:hypothetical protein
VLRSLKYFRSCDGECEVNECEVSECEVGECEVSECEFRECEVRESEVSEGEVSECEVSECAVSECEVSESKKTFGITSVLFKPTDWKISIRPKAIYRSVSIKCYIKMLSSNSKYRAMPR